MKDYNEITAPIVLFAFDRPIHTNRTLLALKKNGLACKSTLYIFCDGPKENATAEALSRIKQTRIVAKSQKWCGDVIVIERKENLGLAANIIDGVTSVVDKHGKVIVLEDDIVTSPGFLDYMNEALLEYENTEEVMHIAGYSPRLSKKLPATYFYNATSCWGWGTWKRAWDHFNPSAEELLHQLQARSSIEHFNIEGSTNFYDHLLANVEGTLKTWAIKWHTSVYLKNGLCLHTYPSLTKNIGMDGSGVHAGVNSVYESDLIDTIKVEKLPLVESMEARLAYKEFYLSQKSGRNNSRSLAVRAWNKLRRLATTIFDS